MYTIHTKVINGLCHYHTVVIKVQTSPNFGHIHVSCSNFRNKHYNHINFTKPAHSNYQQTHEQPKSTRCLQNTYDFTSAPGMFFLLSRVWIHQIHFVQPNHKEFHFFLLMPYIPQLISSIRPIKFERYSQSFADSTIYFCITHIHRKFRN